ncbi:hypothetical protein BST97_01920 [Nonlabens spongiae]|uniref:FAS1 domain-containing protein n=1 Tax=Nonlabens spongiae TaxID=331648 RepID=A0A1W6MGY4_9FLAO|nr:fasciclin domain-containing protein [Nonlabens spongiae]ARN76855.1 hypothetical protein BST97_01920 [Nonlabens spongiae]
MKNLRKLTTAVLILLTATFLTSCDDDDDNAVASENTAYDFLENNPNYSSLKAAVDAAGLRSTLEGNGDFTIFAPDNDAFEAFINNSDEFDELAQVPITTLQSLLLYHILGTEITSSAFANGYIKTAANNGSNSLDAYISADNTTINGVALDATALDIEVDNGVIHAVQGVLPMPTVADLAAYNPDFSNLVTALSRENLVEALSTADVNATPPSPFTVFAPTNDAFQALIDADANDSLNDINDVLGLSNLSDILLYHVVAGDEVRSDELSDNLTVDPITTGTFTVNITGGATITDGFATTTNIVVTDVTGTNGVVHAIDFVLRPM